MTAFFMLSGYSLYLSSGRKQLQTWQEIKMFYWKRFIGVFPLYYLTAILFIAMTLIADYLELKHSDETLLEHFLNAPIAFFGIQSVFSGSFSFSHYGGTWFISCIAICYLAYPYLQQIVNQISEKTKFLLIGLLAFILFLSPILRWVMHWQSIYDNPMIRMMEFTIGILLANINENSRSKVVKVCQTKWALALGVIILFLGVNAALYVTRSHDFLLYNWVALPAFILIMIALGKLSFKRFQGNKTLEYLSAISYVIFLAQFFVWDICRATFKLTGLDSNWFRILLSLTLCFTIAIAMHELFEKPISRYLKQRLL